MRILLKTKNKTIFIPYETCSIEIYDGETSVNYNTWEKAPDYYLIRIICNNNLYVIPYKLWSIIIVMNVFSFSIIGLIKCLKSLILKLKN